MIRDTMTAWLDEPSDDEHDDEHPDREACVVCGAVGGCAYDAEGNPLAHLRPWLPSSLDGA